MKLNQVMLAGALVALPPLPLQAQQPEQKSTIVRVACPPTILQAYQDLPAGWEGGPTVVKLLRGNIYTSAPQWLYCAYGRDQDGLTIRKKVPPNSCVLGRNRKHFLCK